ncbi:MAG TPA: hypothetical protein PKY82_28300 [Pyrinomonadaceae bacterium]|nr:hypothetical protein [Pyrinomonadaceae bacterium]
MKLFKLRTNILLFATLLSFGNFVVWYFSTPNPSQVFYVKVAKEYDLNATDEELAEFIKDGNNYPSNYAASKNIGIPYIRTDLYIRIKKDGRITLNSEEFGSVENTEPLKEVLDKVFQDRFDNGIFEERTNKIFKRVFINRPLSAKYGDVVKVIDAVKSSGAEPIILQIDDLPE